MRYRRAGEVLIAMFVLGLVGHASAGHMGRSDRTIQLDNAWARRTPPMAQHEQGSHGGSALMPDNSAVYITIRNRGNEPDALLSAATSIATAAELHETIEQDGKMVMQPRPKFDVPAGATLEMKPGSYHIMLLRLKQALKPGDTVKVTLSFEKAGEVTGEASVR
jgi:periplasmic copper chaperone A